MTVRLFELAPNAAIAWIKKFLAEEWSTSGIQSFVRFCEGEYQNRKDALAERAEPSGSLEHIKTDQILHHLRNEAWHRIQRLRNIDFVNSKIRESLSR